jgi:hypothetical protein
MLHIPRSRAARQAAPSPISNPNPANARIDLAKQADAILKNAGCDCVTGAKLRLLRKRTRSPVGCKVVQRRRGAADCGKHSKAATIVSAAFLLYSRPAALFCEE